MAWARGGVVANPGSRTPEAQDSGPRPSSPPWSSAFCPCTQLNVQKLPRLGSLEPLALPWSLLPCPQGSLSRKPRRAGSPSLRAGAQPGSQGLLWATLCLSLPQPLDRWDRGPPRLAPHQFTCITWGLLIHGLSPRAKVVRLQAQLNPGAQTIQSGRPDSTQPQASCSGPPF